MMKIITPLIVFFMLCLAPAIFADDIDIYLQPEKPGASAPYLMLMIDYSPRVFSLFCEPLSSCVPKMTEEAFAKLCRFYANPNGVEKDFTESACHLFYRQIKEGSLTSQDITGI